MKTIKNIKVEFKVGSFLNGFKITPCLQITYSAYGFDDGFAIELAWGKWGIGWRFYIKR